MQINVTLSKKEKKHYFFYLLGMLFFTVILLSVAFLYRYASPFADSDLHSVSILQEKTRFDETQKSFAIKTDSLFAKLMKFDPEKAPPGDENEIEFGISEINNGFKQGNFSDGRKEFYPQMAEFYNMYFIDKKTLKLTGENIKNKKNQLDNCMVGYNRNRSEMVQRETRR
ncbi:type VI secretion system TssO [Chryseobacterium sp. TY3]